METVAGVNHLYRRGAVYWFRRRVPDDVSAELGLSQWRVSLHTKDFPEAKRLVRLKSVETDRQIDAIRFRHSGKVSLPVAKADADRMALTWTADALAFDEALRVGGGPSAARWLEESVGQYREALANLDIAVVAKEVDKTLAREGLWYPPGDPSRSLLAIALLKAQVQLLGLMERRLAGDVVDVERPAPAPLTGHHAGPHGMTVKQLFNAYANDRFARSSATASGRKKYVHILATMESLLGSDKPIKEISRDDVRDARDVLRRLPMYAGRRYPGLTPSEAADRADIDGKPRISATTVNAYLMDMTIALNWAVKEGKLALNPATGIMDDVAPSVIRRGFTTEELRRIFAGLQPYATTTAAWKYWLPAMALYSGARASELACLRVGDLSVIDGVQCMAFSIFDEKGVRIAGKTLKNKASERRVPIHQEILSAGLMDYVATLDKDPNTRLFASLPPGPTGKYSHDLSKFFGRFRKRKEVAADSPSTPFHSFRHGFADACREAGVPDEQRLMLGGWTLADAASKYGDRSRIKLLDRELKKVSYAPFKLPPAKPVEPKDGRSRSAVARPIAFETVLAAFRT